MMEDERQGDDDPPSSAGVFGNLPTARPGTRSPRRKTSTTAAAEAPLEPEHPTKARPRPQPGSAASKRPDPIADDLADESAEQRRRSGLEDIAWAGVAAAADAATIGVRLASRAIVRLRDGVDRR